MTDLIQRITLAIFRQEGHDQEFTNPGSLRAAPWLTNPIIVNGFWEPYTRMQGVAGAAHVVALHIAEGQSLRQFITGYAPPGDNNNTEAYIKNVSEWGAIPNVDVPLWTYMEAPYIPS